MKDPSVFILKVAKDVDIDLGTIPKSGIIDPAVAEAAITLQVVERGEVFVVPGQQRTVPSDGPGERTTTRIDPFGGFKRLAGL